MRTGIMEPTTRVRLCGTAGQPGKSLSRIDIEVDWPRRTKFIAVGASLQREAGVMRHL